jgi:hypothetical protein
MHDVSNKMHHTSYLDPFKKSSCAKYTFTIITFQPPCNGLSFELIIKIQKGWVLARPTIGNI